MPAEQKRPGRVLLPYRRIGQKKEEEEEETEHKEILIPGRQTVTPVTPCARRVAIDCYRSIFVLLPSDE